MVSVKIIAVGRLKEKFLTQAYEEYEKRLAGFCRLTTEEVEAAYLPDNPSDAEIQKALNAEAEKILRKIPADSFVIPMCVEGKRLSSEGFAERLSGGIAEGKSSFTFMIGGSYGLADEVKKRGDLKLSMSEMTFPHRLARIMLAEQIYRAFTIINNRKYHK